MINRVQALVLAFFLTAWISLVAILVAAPEVYERRLRSLPGAQRIVDVVFVVALTAFIVFLSIGVLRRWRWAFWLILIAFLLGVLRVPVAVLQLSGQMTPDGPTWYVILQGVIGVVQVLIALTMIHAYRRSGVWDREVAEAHKSQQRIPLNGRPTDHQCPATRSHPLAGVTHVPAESRPGDYVGSTYAFPPAIRRSA